MKFGQVARRQAATEVRRLRAITGKGSGKNRAAPGVLIREPDVSRKA